MSALSAKSPAAKSGRSLFLQMIVPISLVVLAIVAALSLYAPRAVVEAAIGDAALRGIQTAGQLRTLRKFYSDAVVAKAVKGGATASPAYKDLATAIPVPTTFILDVAKAFTSSEVGISLVSPYPWPMRAGRALDAFQREAWETLSRNPDAPVVRREVMNGREMLRVAVGDRMDAGCVACHNSNPQSPKRDWKVGDVRGIIEVVRPVDDIAEGARRLSWRLVGGVAAGGLAIFAAVALIGRRVANPLGDLALAINRIASGRLHDRVPHVGRKDELGVVADALLNLQEQTRERLRAEAQINHMAHHDGLTGLPNRTLFGLELERALVDLPRDRQASVFCLDLDRFKAVNDTLGHPIGDALLRAVAERLRSLRAHDMRVARLGGDEFAFFCIEDAGLSAAAQLAQTVIDRLSEPYKIEDFRIVVGASIGIAMTARGGLEDDAADAALVLKHADLALYRAKADGRGNFRFFEPEMDAAAQARREMELDLRSALVGGELSLAYQPLVSVQENRVCAFEALLRWTHPTRGRVSPDEFIGLAEEIDEIVPIGAWVLKTACAEAATWPKDVRIAVNLSPVQFRSGSLVLHVTTALMASGLQPDRLELEITEGLLLQDTEQNLETLHDLRALGVRISLDDFGTGYSSLSYLRKFPFDKIKIDKSFVNDLSTSADSTAVIRAVINLGCDLGISTTAEGVETVEQLDYLREQGCNEIQGYLISAARPACEVPTLIAGALPRAA